ncbi:hypothetical protein E4U53_000764, partial [Claviceps sorghi]
MDVCLTGHGARMIGKRRGGTAGRWTYTIHPSAGSKAGAWRRRCGDSGQQRLKCKYRATDVE